jgi:hypothetical protein
MVAQSRAAWHGALARGPLSTAVLAWLRKWAPGVLDGGSRRIDHEASTRLWRAKRRCWRVDVDVVRLSHCARLPAWLGDVPWQCTLSAGRH